ncbi:class II aldolase/adducin family protein [Candidatus Izemoplasma sp. B36]|uniref:class II aldolase/adducin family protein n=1 Tax=Candidatus Izemoplasma sp. B36 TaxID=3242468 RepID=UPI003558FD68
MNEKAMNQVASMMRRIYAEGLTTTTGGNISVIDENNTIYITPAGNDKSKITNSDISVIRYNELMNENHPSSELPLHRSIYKYNKKIKAIIHAHPVGIVAFSAIRKLPNTKLTYPYNDLEIRSSFAKYALPGSEELAQYITKEFKNESNAVFLENHGIVIGSTSLGEAYKMLDFIETCCLIETKARMLKKDFNFPHYGELPSGYSKCELNNDEYDSSGLIDLSKRLYKSSIVKSNMAVISKKINGNTFSITRRNTNLQTISSNDVIVFDNKKCLYNPINQPLISLVNEIYLSDNDIQAVIIASPVNAMGFSVSQVKIDSKIIPEGYILLRKIPTLNEINQKKIVEVLSKENPLINVSGKFYISIGKSLLQAYDRLEVLEFGAKSLLFTSQYEKVFTISDAEIDRINHEFTGW